MLYQYKWLIKSSSPAPAICMFSFHHKWTLLKFNLYCEGSVPSFDKRAKRVCHLSEVRQLPAGTRFKAGRRPAAEAKTFYL